MTTRRRVGCGAGRVSSPGETVRGREARHRAGLPGLPRTWSVALGRAPRPDPALPGKWSLSAVTSRDAHSEACPSFLPHPQVLVYELLLGKGFRGGGGRWRPLLERHQARLKAELARLKVQRRVSRNEDLLQVGSRPGTGELEGVWAGGQRPGPQRRGPGPAPSPPIAS